MVKRIGLVFIKSILVGCSAIVGLFLSIGLLIVLFFYISIPWHNLYVWRMEQTLASEIAHPTNSHLFGKRIYFGSRFNDRSECTYVVGQVRSTPLTYAEILNAYRNKTTSIFNLAPLMKVHVAIINEHTSIPLDNPVNEWITDYNNHNIGKSGTTYYIVYLYDEHMPWWGDFRCFTDI